MSTVAVIGSLTRDHITIKKQNSEFYQPGGGVYYSSHALACLGVQVIACPLLAKKDERLLSALQHSRIQISPQWTSETTSYHNHYPADSLDVCEKKCLTSASHFKPEDPFFDILKKCDSVHLVPLSSEEFDPNFYQTMRKKYSGMISLDGQGYTKGPRINIQSFLKGNCNILKSDESEILWITQTQNEKAAFKTLAQWGIEEILVTRASKGSTLCYKGEIKNIAPYPPEKIVDATGCGDAYIAGYIKKRLDGERPGRAAQSASFVGAKNLEFKGALAEDL